MVRMQISLSIIMLVDVAANDFARNTTCRYAGISFWRLAYKSSGNVTENDLTQVRKVCFDDDNTGRSQQKYQGYQTFTFTLTLHRNLRPSNLWIAVRMHIRPWCRNDKWPSCQTLSNFGLELLMVWFQGSHRKIESPRSLTTSRKRYYYLTDATHQAVTKHQTLIWNFIIICRHTLTYHLLPLGETGKRFQVGIPTQCEHPYSEILWYISTCREILSLIAKGEMIAKLNMFKDIICTQRTSSTSYLKEN